METTWKIVSSHGLTDANGTIYHEFAGPGQVSLRRTMYCSPVITIYTTQESMVLKITSLFSKM